MYNFYVHITSLAHRGIVVIHKKCTRTKQCNSRCEFCRPLSAIVVTPYNCISLNTLSKLAS